MYQPNALIGEEIAMKFVVNGLTYSTETASIVAVSRGVYQPCHDSDGNFGAEQVRFENTLYQSPKGALFVHCHQTKKFPKGRPVVEDSCLPMPSPEDAVKWVTENEAAVLNAGVLPLPPEA